MLCSSVSCALRVDTLRCDSGNTFLSEELLAGQETPGKIDQRFVFFFPPLKCSHRISSGRVWDADIRPVEIFLRVCIICPPPCSKALGDVVETI